jgi:replicative DNA helicase
MATHPHEPPNSRDAEEALIGYVLRWPDEFATIDIEKSDFYLLRHQHIWDAFGLIAAKNQSIDTFTVGNELQSKNLFEMVGGHDYLNNLESRVPFGHNPNDSAFVVREMRQRRDMLTLATEIAKTACDHKADIEGKAGEFLNALVGSVRVKGGAVHWSKFMNDLMDEVEQRAKDPREIWGIPTGFPRFDKVTGGLQLGELMIMSGKPGVGKSILEMQRAAQMAKHAPGAIYSIEMSGKQVMRRIVSAQTKIQVSKLKSGRVEDSDWPNLIKAIENLRTLPVFMSDVTGWTTTSLRADLARLKATEGIQWFLIDYLSLLNDAQDQDLDARPSIISRRLKLLCRNLDLAGVAVHSMNKAGIEAKTPDQQHLSGRANVSFDADLICFLTEFQAIAPADESIPQSERDHLRTLFFAKGRELEEDKKYIHMVKLGSYPSFGDYVPEPNAMRTR